MTLDEQARHFARCAVAAQAHGEPGKARLYNCQRRIVMHKIAIREEQAEIELIKENYDYKD